jgi:hypothetical protein
MSVSKKAFLPLIGFEPVEFESRGQGPPQLPDLLERPLGAWISPNFELAFAGDVYLDPVAFPQAQRLNYRGRQTDCQTISPLGDLHGYTLAQ